MPLPIQRYRRPLDRVRDGFALLMLAAAGATRPARWLLVALGIALGSSTTGMVAESQIAGDESAGWTLEACGHRGSSW
ncbi:MAG: hypothetical protein ACLPXZ_24050 [Mycobacterium sp.]